MNYEQINYYLFIYYFQLAFEIDNFAIFSLVIPGVEKEEQVRDPLVKLVVGVQLINGAMAIKRMNLQKALMKKIALISHLLIMVGSPRINILKKMMLQMMSSWMEDLKWIGLIVILI